MITEAFDPAHPELLIDLVLPSGTPPEPGWPVVVWLHGGGWRLQDRTARPDFSVHFAAAGFAMAAIDYRLAPTHRHPAQVIDLRQALRWIRRHAAELGLDPRRIGLWGSSAGGHIAAMTALLAGTGATNEILLPGESVHPDYAEESTAVSCVVDGYAPTRIDRLLPALGTSSEATALTESSALGSEPEDRSRQIASGHRTEAVVPTPTLVPDRTPVPDRNPTPEEDLLGGPARTEEEHARLLERARAASPALLRPRSLPPFLIMHGTTDTAVPADQSRALHHHLVASGGESTLVLIESFGHGFFNPGEVMELGPGVVIDNGRLAAEPDAPCTFDFGGTVNADGAGEIEGEVDTPRRLDVAGRGASFDLVRDFFAVHLAKPTT